jgi:CheY-like chemotaxis protein
MEDNHPTVLVVDDSRDVRQMLVHLLKRSSYTVIEAKNGQEALERISAITPNLILMDISMPVLDGWGTLAVIRQMTGDNHLPVIAVTAHAMAGDREKVLGHGFDAYVSKPLNIRLLLNMIAEHIRSPRA